MKDGVRQYFEGCFNIVPGHNTVINRVVKRGIGIDGTTDSLDGTGDGTGSSGFRTLEYHVLNKMGNACLFVGFIGTPCLYPDLHGHYRGPVTLLDHSPEAVSKGTAVKAGEQFPGQAGQRKCEQSQE